MRLTSDVLDDLDSRDDLKEVLVDDTLGAGHLGKRVLVSAMLLTGSRMSVIKSMSCQVVLERGAGN